MEPLKFSKLVILLLSLTILQGCTIYKSSSASLNQAVETKNRVEVYLKDGSVIKYKRIEKEGEFYIGINKVKRTLLKSNLDPEKILKIRLKDKTWSTVFTVLTVTPTFLYLLGMALMGGVL